MINMDIKQTIISYAKQIPDLMAVYIFGSFSQGQTHKNSDIDIAFLANEPLADVERWQLAQQIAITLKQDVDLVDLSNCSEVLRFMVISSGELIYKQDKKIIEYYAHQTYCLYMDLQELKAEQYLDIIKNKSVYG